MQQMIMLKSRQVGLLFSLNRHPKPYFCPLKTEYYQKFADGLQDCEVRPNNHFGWHTGNIYPGRQIALCRGYTYKAAVTKTITKTKITSDLHGAQIPQWHIDAVEAIYGKRDSWLIAYVDS